MKKVALHTLGCKLNFAETATLGRQFQDAGYRVVGLSEPADVVVLNTCSVTERADRECRQLIRRARRKSPDAAIIVTGCYAQLRPDQVATIPGVDLVLGTNEKAHLVDHVHRLQSASDTIIAVTDVSSFGREALAASSAGFAERTRAFLKIQDGCDYHCSFCTIPRARGESRSVPHRDVLAEVQRIVDAGYREIVLTGVNVGDYGRKTGTSLLELLKEISGRNVVERIRVSSIEPNLLTDELLDFWISEPTMCKHFHIPLQSGSDSVLRTMRRRYLRAQYSDRVQKILESCPDAGIGADVLVGFPGESEREFAETAMFLADLPISYLHVFPYSERPGTDAAALRGRVAQRVRAERAEQLRLLSVRKRRAFHDSIVGRVVSVLVESELSGTVRSGLTGNYVRVDFESEAVRPNELVDVLITGSDQERCYGTIVSVDDNPRIAQELAVNEGGNAR